MQRYFILAAIMLITTAAAQDNPAVQAWNDFVQEIATTQNLTVEPCHPFWTGVDLDEQCFFAPERNERAFISHLREYLPKHPALSNVAEHYGDFSKEVSFAFNGPFGHAWLYVTSDFMSQPGDAVLRLHLKEPLPADLCREAESIIWSAASKTNLALDERMDFANALACAPVDYQDEYGQTPLIYAITNHNRGAVLELLGRGKADANHRTGAGWTPLMYAVRDHDGSERSEQILMLLLGRDADPTASAADGTTAADLGRDNAHARASAYWGEIANVRSERLGITMPDQVEATDHVPEVVRLLASGAPAGSGTCGDIEGFSFANSPTSPETDRANVMELLREANYRVNMSEGPTEKNYVITLVESLRSGARFMLIFDHNAFTMHSMGPCY